MREVAYPFDYSCESHFYEGSRFARNVTPRHWDFISCYQSRRRLPGWGHASKRFRSDRVALVEWPGRGPDYKAETGQAPNVWTPKTRPTEGALDRQCLNLGQIIEIASEPCLEAFSHLDIPAPSWSMQLLRSIVLPFAPHVAAFDPEIAGRSPV